MYRLINHSGWRNSQPGGTANKGEMTAMSSKTRFLGRITSGTGRNLACAIASISFAASASAADLDASFLKAPPVMPDLTWHGITLIGAIDVSGQYEQHGAPYAGGV